jgi:hypothetical protein
MNNRTTRIESGDARTRLTPFLCIACLVAACTGDASGDANDATMPDTVVVAPSVDPTAQSSTGPESPQAAAAVIRAYYDAIDSHEYTRAYLLWSDSGRSSNQTLDEFRAGFTTTASVEVRVGEPGAIEGAAGSRYIEIPVVVEARTTADSAQQFAGTYTLRRAVVDGATDAQRRWHIYSADIHTCASHGCVLPGDEPAGTGVPAGAVSVVKRFGAALRMVSVLAPRDRLVGSIHDAYGPLVTPALLSRWSADPSTAPGRETSNPWPIRIDITSARAATDGAWTIDGDIAYVTTADSTSVVDRRPVGIGVEPAADGTWRIAAVTTR